VQVRDLGLSLSAKLGYGLTMVTLNKIYTRTGDAGDTALGDGTRRSKADLRIEAYGTVDETNSAIGVVRLHCDTPALATLETMLSRIQNDLFDVGADLCVPEKDGEVPATALRVIAAQHQRLELEIDVLNAGLAPLRSFVLPAGSAAAAQLHVARTVCRRAERIIVALIANSAERVNPDALIYLNRLSDFLFVASRHANKVTGKGDVLWVPGKNR
jgi:cob(I)alamin adenosyltransferase